MPKEMAFTDPAGNTNATSYWILTYCLYEPEQKRLTATITGFKSSSDYASGSQQVGAKGYLVTDPAVFDAYFAEAVLSAEDVTLASQVYQYAMDTEDTDGASFFDGASDV